MKKNKIINFLLLGMLIVLVSASLIGCQNKDNENSNNEVAETESNRVKEELVLVEREIASNTDPNFYPGSNHYLCNGAAETLFKIDEKGNVNPMLAKDSKQLDPKTWEISLRPEAVFWSGEPVNSKAVIKSLERTRKTNSRAISSLEGMSFTEKDDWTIEVKTESENQPVPLNLAYMELAIINADKAHDKVETMDMTGMYKVVEFEPKKRIVLEVNDNYYGKKPVIKRIVDEEISDNQARTLAAMSGEADIVRNISNESVAELRDNSEIVLYNIPASNTETIYLNLKRPYLQDEKVRQALSWGLNREELVLLGTENLSIPITSWLSSNPKYETERNIIYTKYDLEKAGQLLDEAGWKLNAEGKRTKNGEILKINLMTWGQDKALGEAIQSQWINLGIDSQVNYGDYSLIEQARETGEWDALIEAWQTYGSEYSLLSGQFSPDGVANYGKYNDDKTNQLLNELKTATDEDTVKKLSIEINRRVTEQAPSIFICPRVETTAVNSSLKGFKGHFRQFENVITADLYFAE